jgi:hypothetical protein
LLLEGGHRITGWRLYTDVIRLLAQSDPIHDSESRGKYEDEKPLGRILSAPVSGRFERPKVCRSHVSPGPRRSGIHRFGDWFNVVADFDRGPRAYEADYKVTFND